MIHKTTRSILSVLLAALLLVASTPLTPAFAGGGGTVSQRSKNSESGGLTKDDSGTYLIYTAENLKEFAAIVNGTDSTLADNDANAKLMNDIVLNKKIEVDENGTVINKAELSEWTPIGTKIKDYTGTFNGNDKTIKNIYISSNTGDDYQGLFGHVGTDGTVKNLTVSGDINGGWYVGGIVGYNDGGTVTDCTFSGTVSGSSYVGGVVGYNLNGSVTDCAFSGCVKGSGNKVGGVVGQNFRASVENCYNTGAVSGSGNSVGGVGGYNSGGSVENCYNTGNVNSNVNSNQVGGVVGYNISASTVKNCYNTGSVASSGSHVGGVVGYNQNSRIENSYNTGEVSGSSEFGGVVGHNTSDGNVTGCYFLQGTAESGIGKNDGSDTANVNAKDNTAFHYGEVAYLLQSKQTDGSSQVWGQAIGEDESPVLTSDPGKTVYKVPVNLNCTGAQVDQVIYTNSTLNAKEPIREGYTFDGWYDNQECIGERVTTITEDTTTLYAKWIEATPEPDPEPEPTPDPEPEEPPYSGKYSYEISTSVGDNGTFTVDRYATEGDTVNIAITPDQAYKLDQLTVTANGKDVELTDNGDGTYTFTMPSADVKISATFAEDPDWTPDEPEEPATDVSEIFLDVAPNAWYKDAVQYAYDNGLMTGVSATEFAPEQTTTRAMIVSMLARLEGVESAASAGFSDVSDSDWYATAVNWAASVGVVNGYEDNTFQPNTAITREQLAAILMNYAAYKGEDVSARADLSAYIDQPSAWAIETMQWAVAEGLISGVTSEELQPQGNATRAQVAAILQRFLCK